ncbi:GlsB/YeaQ/YmgE family stress response membrane protein [Frateuria defendens]|uniref:GlsB/YeaQ/YmgE family stress response membrane protein n=1 Tax=Frateuria defendens TaxID=2219559 RepID=UPI00066FDA64|nr:GlsB/YeaQ/YmgE family stress response membrane protein [Frateuria defendens]
MTATGLIIFLLVGAVAGWLAGLIVRGFGFGLLGNIVVGIVGALLAGWLLPMLGLGFHVGGPILDAIVHALIGAVILLVIIGLVRRV